MAPIKEFLKQPHIQQLLLEEDMDGIIVNWLNQNMFTNVRPLKRFFEEAGIDMIDYITTIFPSYFYYESPNVIDIPDNVTIIARNAFFRCEKLDKVILPKSIEAIQEKAFNSCFYLNVIEYIGTMNEFKHIANRNFSTNPVSVICSDGTYEYPGFTYN